MDIWHKRGPGSRSREGLDDFGLYRVSTHPGKSWRIRLILESPGNKKIRSWKVVENEDAR